MTRWQRLRLHSQKIWSISLVFPVLLLAIRLLYPRLVDSWAYLALMVVWLAVQVFVMRLFTVPWGPALQARDDERRRRRVCIECQYDLRGSPGKCPECGRGQRRDEEASSA